MSAQRQRLDVVSENLANVETTRTPEGGPYRRKRAVLQSVSGETKEIGWRKNFLELVRSNVRHLSNMTFRTSKSDVTGSGVETAVEEDDRPFPMEYDPGHPDADERGYVFKPNVNIVEEMIEMINATRAYQANAAAFEAAKDMFVVSLQI
jgi:flagellar basal-body rod protein FlgC